MPPLPYLDKSSHINVQNASIKLGNFFPVKNKESAQASNPHDSYVSMLEGRVTWTTHCHKVKAVLDIAIRSHRVQPALPHMSGASLNGWNENHKNK